MTQNSDSLKEILAAAKAADWQQVVLNGGPPCFHLEEGKFCLRAERWHSAATHPYSSLFHLLRFTIAQTAE
jgi:hypothetical protein